MNENTIKLINTKTGLTISTAKQAKQALFVLNDDKDSINVYMSDKDTLVTTIDEDKNNAMHRIITRILFIGTID